MGVKIRTKTEFGRGDEKYDSVKFGTWGRGVVRVCEIHMKVIVTDMSPGLVRVIVKERSECRGWNETPNSLRRR